MLKINPSSWQIPLGKILLSLCALIVLFALASITFSAYSKSELQNAENQLASDTLPENKQTARTCCGATQPDNVVETYALIGTYYSLKDNQNSILMFNNKAPQPLVVSPVFFTLSSRQSLRSEINLSSTYDLTARGRYFVKIGREETKRDGKGGFEVSLDKIEIEVR